MNANVVIVISFTLLFFFVNNVVFFFNIANSCNNLSLVQFKFQARAMVRKKIMMEKR